ncbi:MAG: tetratricopeptide repeat protein, partial [Cyanobacteria bacterium J06626_14]
MLNKLRQYLFGHPDSRLEDSSAFSPSRSPHQVSDDSTAVSMKSAALPPHHRDPVTDSDHSSHTNGLRPSSNLEGQHTPESVMAIADDLWNQGKYEKALEHYRQAVHLAPTMAIAHQTLAERLEQQGLWNEAVVHYRRTLELSPHLSRSFTSQSAQPSPEMASATVLQPPLSAATEADLDRAEALCQQQNWTEAIAQCVALLDHNPTLAPAHKLLGTAYQATKDLKHAEEHYQIALQLQPNWAEVSVNVGNLHARQQQWDEAIQNYQQAITLKPDFAGAYRNLAKVWTRKGH